MMMLVEIHDVGKTQISLAENNLDTAVSLIAFIITG